MIPASPITLTERETTRRYEHERRLRMIRAIGPTFIGIALFALSFVTVFFVFIDTTSGHWMALTILDGILLLVVALLYLGLVAARYHRIEFAAILIAATSGIGAVTIQVMWDYTQGFDTFSLIEFTTFAVVVVLAGILGNGWLIMSATLVMNAVAEFLLFAAPRARGVSSFIDHNIEIIAPSVVMYQWIFAAIMLVVWLSFRRTLTEVGVAYERARQLDQLKDQFISSVNHELRTPAMTLQTLLQTMSLTVLRMSAEQQQEAFARAFRASTSVTELITSILKARRIEDEVAQLHPTAVSIKAAVTAAAAVLDPRDGGMVEREVQVRISDELLVWCDRLKFQQILTNLLSNAVKYSGAGTPIAVQAGIVTETAITPGRWGRSSTSPRPMVEIVVRDYGHGIPPEQIPLLFNKFTRLPRDLASAVMGNGLGLYLCRIYTEAMGGRIWVESSGAEGEGSAFHIRLPVPTPEHSAAASHPDLTPTAISVPSEI